MSDKAKALAILAGIGSFYILLSIIESFEWRHTPAIQANLLNQTGLSQETTFMEIKRGKLLL